MGKTSKPLNIALHPGLMGMPWRFTLEEMGHRIWSTSDGDPWGADLILAPNACRFLPGMEKYLDSAIKGARKVKFGKKGDA